MRSSDVVADFVMNYNRAVRLSGIGSEIEADDIDDDTVASEWSDIASCGTFESAYAAMPSVRSTVEHYRLWPTATLETFASVWLPNEPIGYVRLRKANDALNARAKVDFGYSDTLTEVIWHHDTETFADVIRRNCVDTDSAYA
jgi:hypothetical protein